DLDPHGESLRVVEVEGERGEIEVALFCLGIVAIVAEALDQALARSSGLRFRAPSRGDGGKQKEDDRRTMLHERADNAQRSAFLSTKNARARPRDARSDWRDDSCGILTGVPSREAPVS